MKHTLPVILISLLLSACGGGGGTNPVVPVTVTAPAIAGSLYDTSYKNFKSYPIDTITFPTSNYGLSGWVPVAYGFGEFNKQGELGVFTANQNYTTQHDSFSTVTSDVKYLSDFTFWTINSDKTLTKVSSVKGCLHPRKAIVADFNKDDIPDVLVACHGYDDVPFPGEKSKLLLSNGRGNYVLSDVLDAEFNHGVSAADINGDVYPDLVRAAGGTLAIFINQRNGTFVKQPTGINDNTTTGYFNVELVDLNNDGVIDIIASGNDWDQNGATSSPTKVWYGDGNGIFGNTTTVIPPLPGHGVVNDFTIITTNSVAMLYVSRTSDNSSVGGWYRGMAIQAYNFSTGISTLLVDDQSVNWVPWLIPKSRGNVIGIGPYNSSASYQ